MQTEYNFSHMWFWTAVEADWYLGFIFCSIILQHQLYADMCKLSGKWNLMESLVMLIKHHIVISPVNASLWQFGSQAL